MFKAVFGDLERILQQTNEMKYNLNYICEMSLDLLCPPGSQEYGSFRVEKKTPPPDIENNDFSKASTSSTPLEEAMFNVTDLISYGKLIRSNTHLLQNNTKRSTTNSDVSKVQSQKNEKAVFSIKGKGLIKQLEPKGDNVNLKSSTKLLHNQINKVCSLDERNIKVGMELQDRLLTNKEHVNTSNNKNSDNMDFSMCVRNTEPTKYSHSCSYSLLDSNVKLKLPEDLQHVLKQFYCYENIKSKKEDNMYSFMGRFTKLIKTRLVHDLKTHTKNGERYLKYLDVADGVCHSWDSKTNFSGVNTRFLYKSDKQLCLYEAKCHRLLELQLERRLMDVISNAVCSV